MEKKKDNPNIKEEKQNYDFFKKKYSELPYEDS